MSASASSSSTAEKFLTLRSKDNETFTVKESVAVQSVMLKNMVEEGCASSTIPLFNIDSRTLAIVLEYLNKHGDSDVSAEDKREYDREEIAKKPMKVLSDILLAANYLEIKDLLAVAAHAIADRTQDMSVEKVLTSFGIQNDYTPEEEEDIRKKYLWAFE